MKIAPASPNPYQLPVPRTRAVAVAASDAADAPPGSADGREGRAQRLEAARAVEPGGAAGRSEALVTRVAAPSVRAAQALGAYARVAGDGDRDPLREMLGFDAYA